MLLLAESLLKAAGFGYDEIEETWFSRTPLHPPVVVECDEDRAYIRETLTEVRSALDAIGCVYDNFVINARFVSVAGPTQISMAMNDLAVATEPARNQVVILPPATTPLSILNLCGQTQKA
jgi:hypothetical protein